MNKSELISKIAEKSNLTKKDAELALKAFIESVEEALENKEKVQLVGFGTFETKERAARVGRDDSNIGIAGRGESWKCVSCSDRDQSLGQ